MFHLSSLLIKYCLKDYDISTEVLQNTKLNFSSTEHSYVLSSLQQSREKKSYVHIKLTQVCQGWPFSLHFQPGVLQ